MLTYVSLNHFQKACMRIFHFSVVCVIAATNLKAQSPLTTIDTANRSQLMATRLLEEGKYSHTTSRGKVYTLPYDNMPCLVPRMNDLAPMPGAQQRYPQGKMPNAVPRRQLIPKHKDSAL